MGEYIPYSRIKKLETMVQEEKEKGKIVVLTGGTFDLFHAGHVYFLENCKKYGDKLIVNVVNDERAKMHKGQGRPINNALMRAIVVSSQGVVDYCVVHPYVGDSLDDLGPTIRLAYLLKPDIIIQEADKWDEPNYKEKVRKFLGGEVKLRGIRKRKIRRGPFKVSTTEIINKIRRLQNKEKEYAKN